ncbi:MAG: type III-B CRISPR module RAMP protein Cmr4 [Micromonosporaceae bacterium]|nr:type III-B CRISPR module RAMP protein Cmr4 [Micromonosporaceae bacterium]
MSGQREYMLYLYAESPVHAGASDAEGVLDLPIQREASTGYPVIWGQSLKGALRQAAEDDNWPKPLVDSVFGPRVDAAKTGLEVGRLVVGDAQLVAMPVATLRRTFAWVTTGPALARLARKYRRLGVDVADTPVCATDAAVAVDQPWSGSAGEVFGPAIVAVDQQPNSDLREWAGRIAADGIGTAAGLKPFSDKLAHDLVLVGDDLSGSLLKECTEIAVRVQLEEQGKTVKHGPFHTEYLPAETVLAASLTLRDPSAAGKTGAPQPGEALQSGETPQPGDDPRQDEAPGRLRLLLDHALRQVGGDETLGKGLVWCRLLPDEAGVR